MPAERPCSVAWCHFRARWAVSSWHVTTGRSTPGTDVCGRHLPERLEAVHDAVKNGNHHAFIVTVGRLPVKKVSRG